MNNDCILQKTSISQCTKNKRKFKLNIIKPSSGSGKCTYEEKGDTLIGKPSFKKENVKDGDEIELFCEDDDCVRGSNLFKDAIKCILKDLQDTFVKTFNEGPGDCVADRTVKQNMAVFIGPNADLGECEVNISQKIDLKGKKVCLDINKAIMNLQGEEKEKLLREVLDKTFILQSDYIQNRPDFINLCKSIILNKLMSIEASIDSKCSQTISVGQDQNVYLLGDIKCKNSVFSFSQEAIVKAYMSCITGPFLDDLMNDLTLKKLYESPLDADCVFDKTLVQPCDGTTRKYRIDILKEKKGNGTCAYTNNQVISENCSLSKCKVSNWSGWSICAGGKQERTRKVITPGDDCPHFKETRPCFQQLRDRLNADQQLKTRPPPILGEKYGYEWLYYGPSYFTSTQKTFWTIMIIIIVVIWIYTILKK
jgi:hypothetical protein